MHTVSFLDLKLVELPILIPPLRESQVLNDNIIERRIKVIIFKTVM